MRLKLIKLLARMFMNTTKACMRDALGLTAEQPAGQARRATIGYLVYKTKA